MKYYKDANNQVYAYCDDGSQDEFISRDQIAITEKEALKLIKPKPADIQYQNQSIKTALIDEANEKIAVLQDVIDLDMCESNENEQLKQWKKYRILLTRVDTSDVNALFPEKPNN